MVQLPDGSLLTAFGTGFRNEPTEPLCKLDVCLVRWRVRNQPVSTDRTLRDASFDSGVRNKFEPETWGLVNLETAVSAKPQRGEAATKLPDRLMERRGRRGSRKGRKESPPPRSSAPTSATSALKNRRRMS